MKILKFLVVALAFFVVASHAMAASTPISASPSPPKVDWAGGHYYDDIGSALKNLGAGVDNFTQNFYQNTQEIGQKLFMYLSIIAISWAGIHLALAGGTSLSVPMSKMLQTIFLVGFVFYLMGDGYNTMVVGLINGLCDKLASLALPAGANLQDGFINFSSAQWGTISGIWDTYQQQGWFEVVTGLGAMTVLTIVLEVLFIIFTLIAMIGYMSVLVTVGIGLAVGPLLIPFLVLDKTSFLFDGWVRFMIGASFTKVILAIIISIGIFVFKSLGASGLSPITMLIISTAFGGMLAFQLLRAPEIAQAILSGNAVSFARMAGRAGNAVAKTPGMLSKAMPKPPLPPGGAAAGKAVSLVKRG